MITANVMGQRSIVIEKKAKSSSLLVMYHILVLRSSAQSGGLLSEPNRHFLPFMI